MQNQIGRWMAGIAMVGTAMLTGCQCAPRCAPPVGEVVETRTEVTKTVCPPVKVCAPVKVSPCASSTVTVIRRPVAACPELPPVSEITVGRDPCTKTKMIFVTVRPSDDRCFNVQSRNFERPWPWGAYGLGDCCP